MTKTLLWLSAAAWLLGCGDDPGPQCVDTDAGGPEVANAVALGGGTPDNFVAASDGGTFELEFGTQGGWMVRPVVRIDSARLGADDQSCVAVHLEADVPGITPIPATHVFPQFHHQTGAGFTDPVIVFLAFDLLEVENQPCTLRVTVVGPAASSSTSAQVTLVNNE